MDDSAKTNRTALFKIVKPETFKTKASSCMSLGSAAIIVRLCQQHCMQWKKDGIFIGVTMNKILTKGNQNELGGPWRWEKLRKKRACRLTVVSKAQWRQKLFGFAHLKKRFSEGQINNPLKWNWNEEPCGWFTVKQIFLPEKESLEIISSSRLTGKVTLLLLPQAGAS